MEWKPIASAPRDGTEIIIGNDVDDGMDVVWWGRLGSRIGWTDGDYIMTWPTHWMQKPEPPKKATE